VRVLLVSVNRLRFPYPVYPVGLDHVAGAIAPPHAVRILDLCPVEEGLEEEAVGAAVREFAPEAVGVSVRNIDNTDATRPESSLDGTRRAVEAVRRHARAPIVLGGAGFTLFPHELLEALGADYGIVGDGEQARPLFDALEAGRSPVGLPGVVVRGRPAGRVRRLRSSRPPRPLPVGANPAIGWYVSHGGILNLQTQRGCQFHCIYCTYPSIDGGGRQGFPASEAAATAMRLEAAGARFLFLTDSVFNGDPAHSLAVADALRRAGLATPWGALLAPFEPPPGFYRRLAEAGCTHVEFGTESLSDRMLLHLRKAFRRDDALAAHAAAREAGLHVAHFFLLGGPGETAETVDETLQGAEGLAGAVRFFFCGIRILPGTELERIARAAGQLRPGQSLLDPVFYRPDGLSLEAIAERVQRRAAGRPSWIVGDGAERAADLLARMYARGSTGPLWERLAEA